MFGENKSEWDVSVKIVGGMIIFVLFLIGIILYDIFTDNPTPLMTEAVVHSVISFAAGWIGASKTQNGNGNRNNDKRDAILDQIIEELENEDN